MSDNPRNRLKDTVSDGIALDIYYAEEALAIDELVGRNADEINAASYGAFFGSLQIILSRQLILAVSRIFEPQGKRYELRSIPAAIQILHTHAGEIPVEQRAALESSLETLGVSKADFRGLNEEELTKLVADTFTSHVPQAALSEAGGDHEALAQLKGIRDKVVAHPEAINADDLPRPIFADVYRLLEYAKAFVAAVGFGYLSTVYADDAGEYLLSTDAERASRCLRRILVAADVQPSWPIT